MMVLIMKGNCSYGLMTTTTKGGHCFQEAIETLDPGKEFDMELDGKLHVLYGGTKVVQHSPPSKTGPGLKGRSLILLTPIECN